MSLVIAVPTFLQFDFGAGKRFAIERFARDWDETFARVAGRSPDARGVVPRQVAEVGGTA